MRTLLTILLLLLSTVATNATVLSPNGTKAEYLDDKIFYSKSITASQFGEYLKISIVTNYPGYHGNIDYNIADLNIENPNSNLAIQLPTGKVIANPQWETSEILSDVVFYGKDLNGYFISVRAIGPSVDSVGVIWDKSIPGDYEITILIPFKLLDRYRMSGMITMSWATALCANSLVTTTFYYVPKLPPITVRTPTILYPEYRIINGVMTQVVPIPSSVILFGSGLILLFLITYLQEDKCL